MLSLSKHEGRFRGASLQAFAGMSRPQLWRARRDHGPLSRTVPRPDTS
jgi:hypothetical protein